MAEIDRPLNVCVIGAGASGVGLLWSLAMAQQQGQTLQPLTITLIHDQAVVGGHSHSEEVTMGGKQVHIDCGVQMIAPKMYPATLSMLALPDFAGVHLQDVPLKISAVFPEQDGTVPYWGNFPEYQHTPLFQSGKQDCETFADLLKAKASLGYGIELIESLQTMLDKNQDRFTDQSQFITYFLDGYMSIMNGYGNALLDTVIVADVAPLWDLGYASFTEEVSGYGRFQDGADSWVNQMWTVASQHFSGALTAQFNTQVTKLYPSDSGPVVEWVRDNTPGTATFDVVISTVDMHTNSQILNVPENALWAEVYADTVGAVQPGKVATTVWPLQPGFCALHKDPSLLATHDGPSRLETLQFNAQVGATGQNGGFDLSKTFSTYIESNLMGIPVSDPNEDFYLTMYGYVPDEQPNNIVWSSDWNHGMWLPSFMVDQKLNFHKAQGISAHHSHHLAQKHTGIFFAGNNLTMDSEEGALISGMAIAKYAFGIDPVQCLTPSDGSGGSAPEMARIEFDVLFDLMFPSLIEEAIGKGIGALEQLMKGWIPIWGPGHGTAS